MEQNGTKTRIATDVEPALLKLIEAEENEKGCSRALILRWALLDRYRSAKSSKPRAS